MRVGKGGRIANGNPGAFFDEASKECALVR
jgi:hypothetical protein